jgi:Pyruvate/2-oxoacid:ferredoxin oxidoreductase gamma subunit
MGVVYRLPLVQTAADAGAKAATNVVALWAANAIAGVVSPHNLRTAIMERIPARYRESNERALQAAQKLVASMIPPVTAVTA